MQRREFSLSAASLAAAAALGMPGVALAQQAQAYRSGADYLTLDKPAPTEAPAGQIEVVEFFSYNCPHCNEFEPMLEAWVKKLPKDVSFRRAPVSFIGDFEPKQRLYYALEAMGKADEFQMKVFNAIHAQRLKVVGDAAIIDWVEKQGLPKAKFVEMYNSFSVATKVRKATQLQDSYGVDGVPALGVNGRYITSGTQAKTLERSLQVTDYLIAQARQAMGTAAKAAKAK